MSRTIVEKNENTKDKYYWLPNGEIESLTFNTGNFTWLVDLKAKRISALDFMVNATFDEAKEILSAVDGLLPLIATEGEE